MSLWTIKTPPTSSVAASLHILTGAKLSVQSLMFFQALLSLCICLKCKEKNNQKPADNTWKMVWEKSFSYFTGNLWNINPGIYR